MKIPVYEILGGILGLIIFTGFGLSVAFWTDWMLLIWLFLAGGMMLYGSVVAGVFLIGKPLRDYMTRRTNV